MKNLLFVIPTMRIGGAEKSLISLLSEIDDKEYNIDLLLFEGDGILQKNIPQNVNVIIADKITRAMILEWRFYYRDLLHINTIPALISRFVASAFAPIFKKIKINFFSWNIIKRFIPKILKKYDVAIGYLEGYTDFYVIDKVTADKKIAWIHTNTADCPTSKSENDYYNKFDKIITISEVCKESFEDRYPNLSHKILILPNIVSQKSILSKAKEQSFEFDPKYKHIVTIGRLEKPKGIDLAISACAILVKRNFDVQWHVYGEGSLRKTLEKQILDCGLENVFFLEGEKDNPYPYILNADIIAQTSYLEGKSIALDESKILGKAIVSTNYNSVFDQLTDGITGVIVQQSAQEIADGIQKILEDSTFKRKLEDNCKSIDYSQDSAINKFYNTID